MDGNKRTAFEVVKSFLGLNGWQFGPSENDAFAVLRSIASGDTDAESTGLWIARNLSRGRHRK